jgi:hypothetical protein
MRELEKEEEAVVQQIPDAELREKARQILESLDNPYKEPYLEGLIEAAKVSLEWNGSLTVGLARYFAEVDSLYEEEWLNEGDAPTVETQK